MKLLLTIGIFLSFTTSFGQDSKHALTINVMDSLSGNPTQMISSFGIKAGMAGIIEIPVNSAGVYLLNLDAGKYAFEFKNTHQAVRTFTIELNSDSTKTLLFPDPK